MVTTTTLATGKLLDDFLADCRARGLSENTIAIYGNRLCQFVNENPELPLQAEIIEKWLSARGESFSKRGDELKRLQLFYKYLVEKGDISTNPIPAAKMGRPATVKPPKGPRGRPKIAEEKVTIQPEENPELPASSSAPVVLLSPQAGWSPERYKTQDVILQFLGSCKARNLSDYTVKNYSECLKRFAAKYPDHLPMNLEAIEAFLSDYPKEQDERKFLYHSVLRNFYNWIAERKNYPPAHLKFSLISPKHSKKTRPSLSNEQVAQLLALDMCPTDHVMIELMLRGGPRVGEVTGMKVSGILSGAVKVSGKTGQREVQIRPELEQKLRALHPEGYTGYVFTSDNGEPLSPAAVYGRIEKQLARIGINGAKRGPHLLRHTYGRLYIEFGGDVKSLQQQLGHTRLATTAMYTELSEPQVRKRALAADPVHNIELQTSKAYRLQYGDPEETAEEKAKRLAAKPLPGQIHMDEILGEGGKEGGQDV